MTTADVFIQAGHEGRTTGATGGESQWGKEIEWTPIVADEATQILRDAGITVNPRKFVSWPRQIQC
jgi:N-acetylmuramoyl-L-alanine amidase